LKESFSGEKTTIRIYRPSILEFVLLSVNFVRQRTLTIQLPKTI